MPIQPNINVVDDSLLSEAQKLIQNKTIDHSYFGTSEGTKRKLQLQNQMVAARYNLATAGPFENRESAFRNSFASPVLRTSLN